jgi:HAD superfamily hydrolase (TIGR01509 family)
MRGRPQAVLFDFDGTLWDSETAVYEVMRDLYRTHGHELPIETWSEAVGTLDAFDPYLALHELTGAGFDLDAVRAGTEERIRAAARDVTLRPGVDAFLRQVDDAGVPRALVSSDTAAWVRTNLEHLGWSDGWAAIVCADGVVEHSKPKPYLYLTALEALGVGPSSVFAVEDSPNGIRAAKAAGLRCVCVPNEVTSRFDLSEADLVYPSFEGVSLDAVWSALGRLDPADAGPSGPDRLRAADE